MTALSFFLFATLMVAAPAQSNPPKLHIEYPPAGMKGEALLKWRKERDKRNSQKLIHEGLSLTRAQKQRASRIAEGKEPGVIRTGPATRKWVALTFDDGPFEETTGPLLAALSKEQVKATFFLEGRRVDFTPQLVRDIVAGGHEVANHSYNHPNLAWLTAQEMKAQYMACNDAIRRASGVEATLCRPPGGDMSLTVLKMAAECGLTTALWTVNPTDYKLESADQVVARSCVGERSGTIILLHQPRPKTIEALPRIVAYWRDKGFSFVTVSEMVRVMQAEKRK